MSRLYPLLLKPVFKERIWGTRDLSPLFAEVPGTEPVGEVWLTGEECTVANGPLAGSTLGDLAKKFGRELVGESAPQADRFPLLVKFLFPRQKLSVQVHPDDERARRIGQPCGKTECWYVLKAEPGAQVGLGLKPGVTRADFERAIREVRAEELMNWIEVHAGEMIYADAGTVHAIGGGSILLETQQNSDTTYRLYDYGRPRELHVQQGLEAMKTSTNAGKAQARGEKLVESPCFVVTKSRVREACTVPALTISAVRILVATEGCGVLETDGCDPVTFARGEAVVVPASVRELQVRGQWEVELLVSHVPAAGVAQPRTYLVQATSSVVENSARNL
ncbi:MAG TPA: type I phosphomannose isomerase catalytic subunit [Terriglobales bacterium]|nr:type I phosphomannose isomerase catalytic subunit [Terriglobales bacterium]